MSILFTVMRHVHSSTVRLSPTSRRHRTNSTRFLISAPAKMSGLGVLGHDGTSTLSAGVRFAHFTSRSNRQYSCTADRHPCPYLLFRHAYPNSAAIYDDGACGAQLQRRRAVAVVERIGGACRQSSKMASSRWIGVSRCAVCSAGKRRKPITRANPIIKSYQCVFPQYYYTIQVHRPHHSTRSSSVTVPNVGGFVGLSFRYTECQDQHRLSLRYVPQRDGHRHRRGEEIEPHLQRPLCLHLHRAWAIRPRLNAYSRAHLKLAGVARSPRPQRAISSRRYPRKTVFSWVFRVLSPPQGRL